MKPESETLILVVDDDVAFRTLVCTVLEDAGYRTLTAGNGQEGVARLPSEPDLVVTDVNMPGANGIAVLNAVVEQGAGIPVIVMSSWDPTGFDPLEVASKLGAAGTVRKDRIGDLLPAVSAALAGRS